MIRVCSNCGKKLKDFYSISGYSKKDRKPHAGQVLIQVESVTEDGLRESDDLNFCSECSPLILEFLNSHKKYNSEDQYEE